MQELEDRPPETSDTGCTCLAGLRFRIEELDDEQPEVAFLLAAMTSPAMAFAAYQTAVEEFPQAHIILFEHDRMLARSRGEPAGNEPQAAAMLRLFDPKPPGDGLLSARERQVLDLLLRGMSMKAAARILGITARTVAFHKYRLMDRNGLRDNVDLVAFGRRLGLPATDGAGSPYGHRPSAAAPGRPEPCGDNAVAG